MVPRTSFWTAFKIAVVFTFRGRWAAIDYSNKMSAQGK